MIESLQLMLDGKRVRVLVAGVLNIGAIDCCILLSKRWKLEDALKVTLRIVQMIHLVPRYEIPTISFEYRVRFMPDHIEWGQHDLVVDYLGFKVKGRQVSPRIAWVSVES
jgi:hypothetical protein